jgi:predicted XRE-type DNA-binding protein
MWRALFRCGRVQGDGEACSVAAQTGDTGGRRRVRVPCGGGRALESRTFETSSADAQQFKAILAAEIIKALDRDGLSVRAAHRRTGIAATDFSRIRNAGLGRFTVDRLMSIINRLGSRVEVRVRVRRGETVAHEATAQIERIAVRRANKSQLSEASPSLRLSP